MHDLSDINDSDLIPLEPNNGLNNIVDYVNNEIIIDDNNNRTDNYINETSVSDATNEQMQFSVTHNDISQMNDNKRITRKRHISYEDTVEDDDETNDGQPEESIDDRRKGRKYARQQNGGRKAAKANKCMTRNAIAARENREKKKQYIESLKKELAIKNKEVLAMKSSMTSITERNKELECETAYYKAIVANMPQIAALIDHMASAPNVKLIGTSFTSGEQVLADVLKKPTHSTAIDSNSVRKSHRIAAKVESAGICFHVNNNNMSLELCSKCSEASKKLIKIKKEK